MLDGCPGKLWILMLLVAFAPVTFAGVPESYTKAWRDPAITRRLQDNIEKHRKGDARIEVVDAAGKPVADATLAVRQTRHEFLFGCNAFVLGQLKTAEENQRYEEAFVKLFNFATVPFYWEGTEPTRNELRYAEGGPDLWRRPPPDRFLPFAAKHGLKLKGHPLLWHAYNPAWLPKDPAELKELYRRRFRQIADRYAGRIAMWDVVNESQACPKTYPLFSDDRAYVAWAFAEAAPLFPDTTALLINERPEYNFRPAEENPYFAQVEKLLKEGAKIRGIGLQYHIFRSATLERRLTTANPAQMLDLYEKFAGFKLPLYITEITIPSFGTDGEAVQAELVCDHYRLWFGAPTMAGITWWNLGDGTAVKGENNAKGGLLDPDLKPKAAYRALDKLINEEWKTTTTAQTNAQGQAGFRGFFGQYQITVQVGNASRQLELNHTRSDPGPHRLVLKD